jgi:hypothetical protein
MAEVGLLPFARVALQVATLRQEERKRLRENRKHLFTVRIYTRKC